MDRIIDIIEEMETDKVSNYVIAGLDSYLLKNGTVRVFKNSRNHRDTVTPHSHRYNFTCLVLRGHVLNEVWMEDDSKDNSDITDVYQKSQLTYCNEIGKHTVEVLENEISTYRPFITKYKAGETYCLLHDSIHSIKFSKDAIVLFFEGPPISFTTEILEPVVDGKLIKTYKIESHMFLRNTKGRKRNAI